jgi:Protein of unknown function (DUF2933)
MEILPFLLVALVCPLAMGLMMLFMMRGHRKDDPAAQEGGSL